MWVPRYILQASWSHVDAVVPSTNTHVFDARYAPDVVDVLDDVVYGSVLVAGDQVGVKVDHDDAAVVRYELEDVVGDVSRGVAQGVSA